MDMKDILSRFDSAATPGAGTVNAADSDSMRDILTRFTMAESLDKNQKKVDQLSATFKPKTAKVLGSKTDPKNPMGGKLVGGCEESADPVLREGLNSSKFKHDIFETFEDYVRYTRSPKPNHRATLRHAAHKYSGAFASPLTLLRLSESVSTQLADRQDEAKSYIAACRRLDGRNNVSIKVGDEISVISTTAIPSNDTITTNGKTFPSTIEFDGFEIPEEIVDIHRADDGAIDTIFFANGREWPERGEFTTIGDTNITAVTFHVNSASAKFAKRKMENLANNLVKKGWVIKDMMEESTDSHLKEADVAEDIVSQVRKSLDDYLKGASERKPVTDILPPASNKDLGKRVKIDRDLIPKQDPVKGAKEIVLAKAPIKTIKIDDVNECGIYGDEDAGFEIRNGERVLPTRFKALDHAVSAAEAFAAMRKARANNPDYREEK